MAVLVCDEEIAEELIAKRQASGGDRYDEVWNGVYVMSPIANNEHQSLATQLACIFGSIIDWRGLGFTLAGANVSDREDDWTKNYRVPDVLVFSNDTKAINRHTHWFGGPELAIEIVSRGDKTLEKLDFYAAVGTQELLVIDRHPWKLTMYRYNALSKSLEISECSEVSAEPIASRIFPIQFRWNTIESCIQILDSSGTLIRAIPIQM
ncbi:MAG: Uma2 family endonuclease [Pirellula sp.]|jgi:Uma2 family endonuclease|nr:Uma2 family endonuclease [Pirellula sp.]